MTLAAVISFSYAFPEDTHLKIEGVAHVKIDVSVQVGFKLLCQKLSIPLMDAELKVTLVDFSRLSE